MKVVNTKSITVPGTSVSVEVLKKFLEDSSDTDLVSIHTLNGDRPFDSGYITVTLTSTEEV